MANAVLMPKAGITVESCIIGKWEKKVGDQIAEGDILFTYETDKAAFECESTAAGELLEIFFGDGEEVPCLVNVCAIGTKGEDVSALRPDGAAPAAAPTEETPAVPAAAPSGSSKCSASRNKWACRTYEQKNGSGKIRSRCHSDASGATSRSTKSNAG